MIMNTTTIAKKQKNHHPISHIPVTFTNKIQDKTIIILIIILEPLLKDCFNHS